ncbi:MAG: hypothetical protein MUO31_00965 [Thermodesulfovibrionales bacterium]|nr:hypothetical protein [Thermodesulfovibrionales bacterium]
MSYHIEKQPNNYSDYVSLKRHVENITGPVNAKLVETWRTQTGTAGTVELEEKAGQTIAHVGKGGLTLVMACDVNDNAYDTHTVYIRYITTTGTKGYCYATYDPTATTTEVAFVDVATGLVAVTDFYMPDTETYGVLAVISSVAVQAGDNVCIGITGCVAGIADPNLTYIKILAAATSPTLANCHGVGSLWGRGEADSNDGDGTILTLDYITPWGTIVEGATCTINTTTTTAVKFFKSDGVNYVMDYYRTRHLETDTAGTANVHSWQIGDFDFAAIYGVIEELLYVSAHTRYMAPAATERTAWFGRLKGTNGTAIVTALAITLTPIGEHVVTLSYVIPYPEIFNIELPFACPLEPLSEVTITIYGNTAVFEAHLQILEHIK